MAEERSCETCRFHFGNSKLGVICDKFIGACKSFDKWQSITKPKVQHTKEEWANMIDDLDWNPDVMVELEQKGYIRKSSLVELVEEAEKMYDYWYSDKETNCEVVMDAMKIAISKLKKDHPEFGGKK